MVRGECLTYTLPPWVTSKSVDKFQRNLTNFSFIGSADNPVTFDGNAVLPTALKVKSAEVALVCNAAL